MSDTYFHLAVELCQELIRCPSNSGQEGQAAVVLQSWFTKLGYDEIATDKYGNIIGIINGSRPGPCVLLDGHIDTVPVNESEWTVPPFGGEIRDGRIYGRGASDMKGAVAAMAVAGSWFAAETNRNFAGRICVAGVVHEECFEGVASREVSAKVKPDFVVIGEASELNLKIGQRGRAEIVVETFGKPAHSANPEKGVNAVHMMTRLLAKIEAIEPKEQPILGKGICVLTDIKSSPYPGASVVPSNCRATYDRRLLVGEDPESTLQPIRNAIAEQMEADADFKAEVYFAAGKESCYTGETIEGTRFFPAWLHDAEEPFIQDVLKELTGAGLHPELSHYAFCTNGSHYAGEAKIPTIGFGPSRENLAHTIDEHIEIVQLEGGTTGYKAILKALLRT